MATADGDPGRRTSRTTGAKGHAVAAVCAGDAARDGVSRSDLDLIALHSKLSKATGAIVRQRVWRIKSTGVQPHAICAQRPRFLDGTREQEGAESLTNEGWDEAEVGKLDLVRTGAAELEIPGTRRTCQQLPHANLGRREMRAERVVAPGQPVAPVPAFADGAVKAPIRVGRTRIATDDL